MSGPKLPIAFLGTVPTGNVPRDRIINALENEGFRGTDALQALELEMAELPEGTLYRLTAQIGVVQGAIEIDGDGLIQMRREGDSNVFLINVTRRGPVGRGDPLSRGVQVIHRDQRRTDWQPDTRRIA